MAALDDLPPLREVIARHGLNAVKALGQNFLLDLNLTARIARGAGEIAGETILEIGPGPGGLTRALLALGASRVIAVERDRRCIAALHEIAARYPGRLEVVEGDALALDMAALLSGARAKIVANLPYNIATPLIVGWLKAEPWPPWWSSMTLMVQREVAERLVAAPGSKTYGRLSVLAQWRSEPSMLFDVAPSAFVPPPKVTSSVVHFAPRVAPFPCQAAALERVTAAAFGQRRKMLRAALKSLTSDVEGLLARVGLAPTLRAEQVPVETFARLAAELTRAARAAPGHAGAGIP